MTNKKYIPCCGRRCWLAKCDTRDEGGCDCLCRLIDAKNTLESCIKGECTEYVYVPGKVWEVSEEKTEFYKKRLEDVLFRMAKYENKGCEDGL